MNQRCEICDTVFTAHMDSTLRYCKLCEQMIDFEPAAARRLCRTCGKPLPPDPRAARYCDRCADVADAWLRTHHAPSPGQRPLHPPKRTRRKKASIPEMNQAAREAGLSYGRYVSWILSRK